MKKWLPSALLLAILPFQSIAGAYEDSDFIGTNAMPLNSLIISIFVMVAVFLIGSAIYGFKQVSLNPNQHPLGHQIMKLVSGVGVLSSASIYHMLLGTVGINSSYSSDALSIKESELTGAAGDLANSWLGGYLPIQTIEILMSMVFLFGVYSFLQGILILKNIGAPQQSQGQEASPLKKSVIHLVAGMIAMNIMDFACFIGNTLGLPILCVN
ncbi:hypothetical protein LMH73_003625 [Vibrio splendidus]|nr:hypothetical protein [Vibrio splendidus]MCC4883224.1 hypothetical protein [Vibrio splendidus]